MNNELSKEELTNIIKIYKIFNDEEISMMINEPNLISDNNIRLSLIKLINNEDNVLNKMKYYFDKYTFLTGGKGGRSRRKKSKRKRSKKKSKRKKSKKKSKRKRSKGKKSKRKKSKRKSEDNSSDNQYSNESNNESGSFVGNNESGSFVGPNNTSGPVVGNNRLSGSYTGIPNITINNNNNNGTQTIDDKNIPQISIPLKFVINTDDMNNKKPIDSKKKSNKKMDKKKGGTNIEINKSDGLDILKNSLQSGETEFNLTFDFNKNIDYENQDFSNFMGTIKNFVKEKANDVSNNKNVPQFKSELKQKINTINNLLPPFYSQDVILP